jgi:trigger factor
MPAQISEIGPCKKLVKVTVPQDRVKQQLEKNYHELTHTIALPGFRKGRVPRALLEKRFGKHVEQELKNTLIQETLGEALEEGKLQPIGEPKLDKLEFDAAKDPALQYEATVAVRPEFALPDLNGIKIDKGAAAATDEDVNESLEASRRARGELKPKPEGGTVGAEDFLVADVEYFVDGSSVRKTEGGHFWVRNKRLDGPTEIPDLVERLSKAKVGDTAELKLKLDDHFPVEAARGKDATVKVAVKELKEVKMPALDDAFAKDAGFETLKELKDEIRQRLLRQREEQAEADVEEKALEAALSRTSFELPQDIVDQELDELALRAQLRSKYQGASEEEAAAEAGKIRSSSRADVERRLKGIFLLDRIAKDNKIFATEDEVEQAIAGMAARYGRPPAEVEAELEKQGGVQRLRFDLRMDKARKWLRSKVEVQEKTSK